MPSTKLIESLQSLRRRVKVFGVLYGAGLVIASAVGLLLAVVLIDRLLRLPTPLRLIVNLAALGTLVYAAWHWIARGMGHRQSLSDLAGRLEQFFPHFEDTLRSTVEFVRPSGGEIHGSAAMKERTIAEAHSRAGQVNLNSAVALKPVYVSVSSAVASLVLVASLTVLAQRHFPEFLRIAANHLIGGSEPWPRSTEIDLVNELPRRVPVGQVISVRLTDRKHNARKAIVEYSFDNGRQWAKKEISSADADGTFACDIDTLEATAAGDKGAARLQIRLTAGDDQRDLNVEVVPRLELTDIIAAIKPPPYADPILNLLNITSSRIAPVVLASDVELRFSFNKQLMSTDALHLDAAGSMAMSGVNWSIPSPNMAVAHFRASRPNQQGKSAADQVYAWRFTVRATDHDGFENNVTPAFGVDVREDRMPNVSIKVPQAEEDRTPAAMVPIEASADDDFGLDSVQLVVNRITHKPAPASRPAGDGDALAAPAPEPQGPQHWVIDLHSRDGDSMGFNLTPSAGSLDEQRFDLKYNWKLPILVDARLRPGDELEAYLQVKDNYSLQDVEPHQHEYVKSNKIRIFIISDDEWAGRVDRALADMRQRIGSIKNDQESIRDQNKAQAEETARKQKFDDAERATVNRLAGEQTTTESQTSQDAHELRDLIKKMTENNSPEKGTKETVKKVTEQLEQTAEGSMKQATNDLNQARQAPSDPKDSPQQRKASADKASEAMKSAAKAQDQAAKELDQAMNALSDFGGLSPMIDKIQKIADQQRTLDDKYKKEMKPALGKTPDQLTAQEKKKADDFNREQQDLKDQTAKALDQMEKKAEKMEQSDSKSAEAMKSAAQAGKQQGIPQKQQQAGQEMQQNQQSGAQDDQKQVELGLDLILERLKEADREKLEELRGKLAELMQRIDEVIGRQAAHNLDNLWLQDNTGKLITNLTEADRKDLFNWSKRKPEDAIHTDIDVLTPSQEQTQRTCRAVADVAHSLPDTTASSKLTAAGTKMEQAIVYLRKNQLPDAYAPSQVEALKLLVDARKAVEAAKKKIEEQQRQQNEETIKQAYVKLLEQQRKLDDETMQIDSTPRDGDGNLPRAQSVRLGALPGEQGKLSDSATELGKKLEGIGSVVYVWANKDIVDSMGEVKDDLAKPETGGNTQSEQKRIEEQLDAMVKNLAQKIPPKPFEQARNGGGGGGGGGGSQAPKMPTDVELRLLRDLQIAVSRSTVKIADSKEKDPQKLSGLSGRQGSLRSLLNELLTKSTQGQVKLGPEPKAEEKLPEEADKDAVDDQELLNNLLNDNVGEEEVSKKVKLTGDRMARSKSRLKDGDPGKTTQLIQKRIVEGMEDLIKLAQKQQGQSQPQPGQKPGQQPGQPQPGQGEQLAKGQQSKSHQEKGSTPAQQASLTQGGPPEADLSKPIRELNQEWGGLSPRERQAVLEGAGEKPFSKYEKFIKDYYRELAKKASEKQ